MSSSPCDVILASASPRRKVLLESVIGATFSIISSDCEEVVTEDPIVTASENALRKWHAVYKTHPDAILIAADTVIFHEGKVIGKPQDHEEAIEMLMSFSGKRHMVFTAVVINPPHADFPTTLINVSSVKFKPITRADAVRYANHINSLDRAGAYDINEDGDWLIDSYIGSYSNIMGLPHKTVQGWFSRHAPAMLV